MEHRQRHSLLIVFVVMSTAFASVTSAQTLDETLLNIETRWATADQQFAGRQQKGQFRSLLRDVREIHQGHPNNAKTAAWHGIVARSYLEIDGSLRIAKEARDAFLQAESLDPLVFGGLVYANLGALYTDAPSKFGGFGNKTRGLGYFWKALVVDPDGVESNYLYAKMLAGEKDYQAAHDALIRANAPVNHRLQANTDRARRQNISDLLEKITPRL